MRILCLISAMGPGGAERVMAWLASNLAERDHDVILVTLEPRVAQPFYSLSPNVELVQMDRLTGASDFRPVAFLDRLLTLRRMMRELRPDGVLSFLDTTNITALLASRFLGVPVAVSERTDPVRHRIGFVKSLARRLLYPFAFCCVAQTEKIGGYYRRFSGVRVVVIPNPVVLPETPARPGVPNKDGRFTILAIGRLDRGKGLDVLIRAFGRIVSRHPDWDLTILGEGQMRAELDALVAAHGLAGRVRLPGVVRDVERHLEGGHVMAFPSSNEGFPNALAEGLATGLPAIGFAGVSGVEELILPGETGFLADDEAEFETALENLMGDSALRVRLGAAARKHIQRFRPEMVLAQWEQLLAACVSKRPHAN